MFDYAITSVSGWLMLVVLSAIIVYPFALRAGLLGAVQPFLPRMRLHAWLGYSLAIIMLIHIWFSMSGETALVVNALGLYLASVAMLLVGAQLWLGRRLRWPTLARRKQMRRWHFWLMVGIVVFILAHVALDSMQLHALLLAI
ncbi:MAG TPA: hypothetical protein VGD98_08370 [Ktedonobacteraceae bacterium]